MQREQILHGDAIVKHSAVFHGKPRRLLAHTDATTQPGVHPGSASQPSLLDLADRLHVAIEREKSYPLSARRLGREGTTRVAFRLRPDGGIDDLVVADTSGEPALDRAALRAVSGITPFTEAGNYLADPEKFLVAVEFRLR